MSWLHGLIAGDPVADSKACLTCHKMPDTAFNAHSASADVLEKSTERLAKYVADLKFVPPSARAQSVVLPTKEMVARGLHCATCHQEHQGVESNLKKITDEQCRACHVAKFDSFDGHHPPFGAYPFKRRTRIIYDHAGHFGKHYPEVAKKEPSKRVPGSCSSCHDSDGDRRIMAVAPFEKTCSRCHLGQITGEQRATGPKGVEFLALPGIDLDTIRKRNGVIGEWPEGSEAQLTAFMKVMISRGARGRAVIKSVTGMNLQDLAGASDGEIKAVTDLVWEIKSLFFALISGRTSDVFGELKLGSGAALTSDVIANLTAGIPRDVLIATQQRYLPNLAGEMANGPSVNNRPRKVLKIGESAEVNKLDAAKPASSGEPIDTKKSEEAPKPPAAPRNAADPPVDNPQACLARVLGQCLLFKFEPSDAGADNPQPGARAPRGDGDGGASPARLGGPNKAGAQDVRVAASPEARPAKTKRASSKAKSDAPTPLASAPQKSSRTNHKDDLLFPTKEEQRAINAHRKQAGREAQLDQASPGSTVPSAPAPITPAGSGMDAESWTRHGGWYQQDHVIYYRPVGHKDMFIYTWLTLTGPLAPAGAKSPAAAVFDALTAKEAQGSCAKCHSVDANPGGRGGQGRRINFSPLTVATKKGRLTRFIHQPHFGVVDQRGCLTCHNLEKSRSYLKGYEQGNPETFVAEFGVVKRDSCRACHSGGKVRQDCLLCHKYHLHEVVTPIPITKLQSP